MSWHASGLVEDGNTEALEHVYNTNRDNDPNGSNHNMHTDEQFEFGCTVVGEAFEAGVVEGTYSVSLSGHCNPDQENDRKSLNISFSPITIEKAPVESLQEEAA